MPPKCRSRKPGDAGSFASVVRFNRGCNKGVPMTDDNYDIRVLNGLIETVTDSAEGHRRAADASGTPRLANFFRQQSVEHRAIATRLQAQVQSMGGTPAAGGPLIAPVHQLVVNSGTVIPDGDQALVDAMALAEDHVLARFEYATVDLGVSAMTAAMIAEAWTAIADAHDAIHDLRQVGTV
jgi:uncharacterized protein (TIGR02284 family)